MTWWIFELNHDIWCWPSLKKQHRLNINVTRVAQRKKPSHMQIYEFMNVSHILSETGIQVMATQLEELFGKVPMTFKRNATLELGFLNLSNIINKFFILSLTMTTFQTLTWPLPAQETECSDTLDLLQHLAIALLCGIVIVRRGKPSWKVNKS